MTFSERFEQLGEAILHCIYTIEGQNVREDDALDAFRTHLYETVCNKGIVYVIGNGGSAGIASHFSNDLMKALKIPSLTFYDSNLMTCLSNDLGYENVFSYPLELLLKPSDLLVAISSSGKSPNVLLAAQEAKNKGVPLITLTGFSSNNPLRQLGAMNFWIDRCDYGLVETAHFFLLHTIVDFFNRKQYDKIHSSACTN